MWFIYREVGRRIGVGWELVSETVEGLVNVG
jgi:hypothetical protein